MIVYIIIKNSLWIKISPKPRIKKVLNLAQNVFNNFNPTNRKIVSKYLLYVIHVQNMQMSLSMIQREADIFVFNFLVMVSPFK